MRIETIEPDGSLVIRHTRHGGFTRLKYSPAEVVQLIELDLLREYIKPNKRARS
jgi:hypothetical protein